MNRDTINNAIDAAAGVGWADGKVGGAADGRRAGDAGAGGRADGGADTGVAGDAGAAGCGSAGGGLPQLPCEVVRDLLPSYADGLTGDVTSAAVAAHLEGCAPCSESLAAIKAPEDLGLGLGSGAAGGAGADGDGGSAVDGDGAGAGTAKASEGLLDNSIKQIDYLKKLRRRVLIMAVVIVVATVLALLGYRIVREYFVGYMGVSTPDYVTVTADGLADSNGKYPVELIIYDNEGRVCRVSHQQDEDGTLRVTYAVADELPWGSRTSSQTFRLDQAPTQIVINGLLVWENGRDISRTAGLLFRDRNPYVGNMPANARLVSDLAITRQFGRVLNELQTDAEPYGWTLVVDEPIAARNEAAARGIMEADACLLLATVGNLGYLEWEYTVEVDAGAAEAAGATGATGATRAAGTAAGAAGAAGTAGAAGAKTLEPKTLRVTLEQANELLGVDVKECGKSGAGLEELLGLVGYEWAGITFGTAASQDASDATPTTRPIVPAATDGNEGAGAQDAQGAGENSTVAGWIDPEGKVFGIGITNLATDPVWGFGVVLRLDGKTISSSAVVNANGSPLSKNSYVSLDVMGRELPQNTTALDLAGFTFDISAICEGQTEVVVAQDVPLAAGPSNQYDYVVKDGPQGGFILEAQGK